jgi:penicillin-binding protein 2
MGMFDRRAPARTAEEGRLSALTLAATGMYLLLAGRLFDLQILQGRSLLKLAEQNRTQVIPLLAPRGRVLDRHGDVLLDNVPRFSLFYTRPSGSPPASAGVEKELRRLFPGREDSLARKTAEAFASGKMTRLLTDIPRREALALVERQWTLPGVRVVVEARRRSRYGAFASHLLGYVDEIDAEELQRYRGEIYRPGQFIGKAGLERHYDPLLRGQDGGLQFEMNAVGRHVQIIRRLPPTPGMDLSLTIDRSLQEAVEKGLEASPSRRGAAVALDPRTGAVLALASAPDFDPSEGLARYLGESSHPLFNRATQGMFPPGSVFKIITAAAALEEARWNVRRTYFCGGSFKRGDNDFGCWNRHGVKDFMGAVAWSCNVYFYNMGLAAGPDAIERTARSFGLGEKTGIDLFPAESAGVIPGREWKKRRQRGAGWFDGDTLNVCIGQGAALVTPLQAAAMAAAAANGGYLWRPFVADHFTDWQGTRFFERRSDLRRRVELSDTTWDTLHRALEGVVLSGSGRGLYRPDLRLGAKTGTAQNPHGEDHSWFAAYGGPVGESPSLAVVVFVENGGMGSVAAGPVARAVIETAFPRPAPGIAVP